MTYSLSQMSKTFVSRCIVTRHVTMQPMITMTSLQTRLAQQAFDSNKRKYVQTWVTTRICSPCVFRCGYDSSLPYSPHHYIPNCQISYLNHFFRPVFDIWQTCCSFACTIYLLDMILNAKSRFFAFQCYLLPLQDRASNFTILYFSHYLQRQTEWHRW